MAAENEYQLKILDNDIDRIREGMFQLYKIQGTILVSLAIIGWSFVHDFFSDDSHVDHIGYIIVQAILISFLALFIAGLYISSYEYFKKKSVSVNTVKICIGGLVVFIYLSIMWYWYSDSPDFIVSRLVFELFGIVALLFVFSIFNFADYDKNVALKHLRELRYRIIVGEVESEEEFIEEYKRIRVDMNEKRAPQLPIREK